MNLQAEKLELFRMLLDTDNDDVLKKVKAILKKQSKNDSDETSYLLSTEANKRHLEEGMKQAKEGKTKTIPIKDLWK
jgi:hypothetical protein